MEAEEIEFQRALDEAMAKQKKYVLYSLFALGIIDRAMRRYFDEVDRVELVVETVGKPSTTARKEATEASQQAQQQQPQQPARGRRKKPVSKAVQKAYQHYVDCSSALSPSRSLCLLSFFSSCP